MGRRAISKSQYSRSVDTAWKHADGPTDAFRDDALRAIAALGSRSKMFVKSGTLVHLGNWLNWPEWLFDGTEIPRGPIPEYISARDDLLIVGNLHQNADLGALLRHVSKHVRPAFGPGAGLMYLNAPTIADALDVITRVGGANTPYLSMRFDAKSPAFRVIVEPSVPLGRLTDATSLLALILMYKVIETLDPDHLPTLTFRTSCTDRKLIDGFAPFLKCDVECGAPVTSLSVPEELASQSNPEFDQALWLLALEKAHVSERKLLNASFEDAVRGHIAAILASEAGAPKLERVAESMGCSPRTAIRKLSEDDSSFQKIADEERRKLALELLNNPSLRTQAIAVQLGFADQSSFGRTFRRWFGVSPGRYRKGGNSRSL